ncbi:MAG TPA: pyridoxal-dependent decarboxylase [Actinophytocola sp.]|nr:pyridoxal-dependent decarboxylase [Actinophytocola sp.]
MASTWLGTPCGVTAGALDPADRDLAVELLTRVVTRAVDFKLREAVFERREAPERLRDVLLTELPRAEAGAVSVVDQVLASALPFCKNEASPRFLGFGDTGADLAALCGGVLALFTQQNLLDQDLDAPWATFAEIAVLRWLRELLGYPVAPPEQVRSVWDVGALITAGGTMSNTVAMLLAREHAVPGTMRDGVRDPDRHGVVVPAGIGHYSLTAAAGWIGTGTRLIEVDTVDYRYDQQALRRTLREHRGRVMCVVAYAGDTRTQTIEHLRAVADITHAADPGIWLHADASWGLMAALTDRLTPRLDGITEYDSITVDPHKVMDIPYNLSALLLREPRTLRLVGSFSEETTADRFDLGQASPFMGSRGWCSLMLWTTIRAHGREGLAARVDHRLDLTRRFTDLVDASPRLLRLHEPDMTAVAFLYLPHDFDPSRPDLKALDRVNAAIHDALLERGDWYFHRFALHDAGTIRRGAELHPLRFAASNHRTTPEHLRAALDEVIRLGRHFEHKRP